MRHPFRSEADAYYFVIATAAAFAAIAAAAILGGAWAGVPVWAALTTATAVFYLRRTRPRRMLKTAPGHVGGPDERRVLVVANETLADERLLEALRQAGAGPRQEVLVVCPALISPVRHWASDVDNARARAQERLDESLGLLRAAGIEARGEIGDEEPLQAIEDALRTFRADEIIITTRPEKVVAEARERFALPITYVGIDAEAGAGVSRVRR